MLPPISPNFFQFFLIIYFGGLGGNVNQYVLQLQCGDKHPVWGKRKLDLVTDLHMCTVLPIYKDDWLLDTFLPFGQSAVIHDYGCRNACGFFFL